MTKFLEPEDFTSLQDPKLFPSFAARWIARASDMLRGSLDFGDNVRAAGPYSVALSPTADTVVQHTLGSVPTGYLVVSRAIPATVYDGTTPWTTSTLSLRGSTSFVAKVWVI